MPRSYTFKEAQVLDDADGHHSVSQQMATEPVKEGIEVKPNEEYASIYKALGEVETMQEVSRGSLMAFIRPGIALLPK